MNSAMKKIALAPLILLLTHGIHAQTKIFKEVGEDISTQIRPITQDNALVGYLAFTRLEQADADSFNYRVTIIDENLHDIGAVNFRQENLLLEEVAVEQNVLCLGYIQSPLAGGESVRTRAALKKAQGAAASSHILMQFISLNGRIINTYYKEVYLKTTEIAKGNAFSSVKLIGYLKYGMQIRNIPDGGFCVFYGDDDVKRQLLVFDGKGSLVKERDVPLTFANHYYMRTSASDVYLLIKDNEHVPEGGFTLYIYSAKDLSATNNFPLRDSYDNWLKVLSFDNDPATGDAIIAGCIINPKRERQFFTGTDYSYAPYLGLFTLDLGNTHKDMNANCSYWSNENMPGIGRDGLFTDKGFYVKYATAFRDYNGNTIFAGSALIGEGFVGAATYKFGDGVFVRQEASGSIVLDNSIPCDKTKVFGPTAILFEQDKKEFYNVASPDTKNNYTIINDEENIYIYDVNGKKLMRTIPHKDGNLRINVYPAKEGHVMVSEYNRKEKTTRFSIEAL
jgi:hypothetical protein